MTVKLAVPSKGRMMAQCAEWFAERGVTLSRTGAEREYSGAVDGVEGVDLVLLSAGEIPRELAAGRSVGAAFDTRIDQGEMVPRRGATVTTCSPALSGTSAWGP